MHQGAEQGIGVHGAGGYFGMAPAQVLEDPQPKPVAMLEHVGLVGQGEGATLCGRSPEGRFQQTPHGWFRVDGEVHGPAWFGGALQTIGTFRVLTEDFDIEPRLLIGR